MQEQILEIGMVEVALYSLVMLYFLKEPVTRQA